MDLRLHRQHMSVFNTHDIHRRTVQIRFINQHTSPCGLLFHACHRAFNSYEDEHGQLYYIEQIRNLHHTFSTTVYVDFAHLQEFNETLAGAIEEQYVRFVATTCFIEVLFVLGETKTVIVNIHFLTLI
jgi:hypothetical protein